VRAALRHAGVRLDRVFREEHFLGTHLAVAEAVLQGRVDVGATYFGFHPGTTEIARAGWRQLAASRSVRVLAHAGPIPSDFLAAHCGIDPAVVRRVQAVLLDGAAPRALELAKSLFSADGFLLPSQEHLAMLRGLLASVE
jgi:ABC-type phosphate/phosphonate transport system substrate-binding protein